MARFLLSPLMVLTIAGCAAGDSAASRPVARDSAGTAIVENPADAPAQWTLSEQPAVVIGSQGGDPAYLFDRIMGIDRLSDGRWVVAEMGSSQVRYYSAEGQHLHSVGREGDGPGEFRQVMAMFRMRGDTVSVDDGHRRQQLFDENGQFVAALRIGDRPSLAQQYPVAALKDGSIIVLATPAFPQRLDKPQMYSLSYLRAQLQHHANAAELVLGDTLVTWQPMQLVPGWRNSTDQVKFAGRIAAAVLSDGFATADPTHNEVRFYDAKGALRTIARREWTPVPVTDDDAKEARARYIDQPGEDGRAIPESLRRQRIQITETWQIASHMPAFSAMLPGTDDTIWLKDFVPNEEMVGTWHPAPAQPAQWTVIDRNGTLLATVQLPARFKAMVFGEDYVAGLYRDQQDVEYVHVYSLNRG